MPNDPIDGNSVSIIKQIQLPDNSYAALRASALTTGTVNLGSTSTVIAATTNLPEGLALTDGVLILITNNVVSSASGWTLNVDNTGPKPVYSSLESSTRTSTVFKLNTSLLFRYNATRVSGGCWDVYGYDESFQKGKTYYIDLSDSNGEIQTSADIYDILQQDKYANFILDLEHFGYYNGEQAILIQRPMTRSQDNAIFCYIDNNTVGESITFYNFVLDSSGNYYDVSQIIDVYPTVIPIFPLSAANKTCATTQNMMFIMDSFLKGGHVVFMNPTTEEIYTYLLINNYVNDDATPEYKLEFYGITKENVLIQIILEPNPDSNSNYKMIGTYTETDLNEAVYSLLTDGTLYIGKVSQIPNYNAEVF